MVLICLINNFYVIRLICMKSPGISDSYDKPTKEILSTKNDDSFMDESSFHFVRKGHRKNKSPLKK